MTASAKRTRLDTDARREQLLAVGARVFAERPYESVVITDIAEQAGVSRGLMYHYFPSKRDFAIAITQHACADMFAGAAPDPSLPVQDRLAMILDSYFAFAAAHRDGFKAMHRSLIADEEVRRLRERDLAGHEASIVAAFGLPDPPPAHVHAAIRGWLALTIAIVLEWLEDPAVDQQQARQVCVDALFEVLSSTGAMSRWVGSPTALTANDAKRWGLAHPAPA